MKEGVRTVDAGAPAIAAQSAANVNGSVSIDEVYERLIAFTLHMKRSGWEINLHMSGNFVTTLAFSLEAVQRPPTERSEATPQPDSQGNGTTP